MTAGILIGRCRLCAKVVETGFADYERGVDDEIQEKRSLGTHRCADGAIGVCDLLGARPAKKEPSP